MDRPALIDGEKSLRPPTLVIRLVRLDLDEMSAILNVGRGVHVATPCAIGLTIPPALAFAETRESAVQEAKLFRIEVGY